MAAKVPRARVLPFLVVLALTISGAIAWTMRPPAQRPSTLPDGASIMFEEEADDGSYEIIVRTSEPGFVGWMDALGMHEVVGEDPGVREWEGGEIDGCETGGVFDHDMGAWGLACPREPRFDPGRPYGVHGVLHVR
jgi:hypothetical protein